jgi:hypothetical protein
MNPSKKEPSATVDGQSHPRALVGIDEFEEGELPRRLFFVQLRKK